MSLQRIFTATLSGIVIGLLIAPAKGSETRQKLADSADQIKDKIRRLRGATNQELDELQKYLNTKFRACATISGKKCYG